MRLYSIASGSSGNCIYIGGEQAHILVDAGISNKRIEAGLNEIGLSGSDINAICITHEHSDHIKAIGVISRKYEIPIYATEGTIEAIKNDVTLGMFPHSLFRVISHDEDFEIGDVTIKPFSIYHDAADPVGYRFECGGKSVAVATDMGHYDDYTVERLKHLNAILIESNHDIRMLETGSYPYYLKRRILGDSGHMCNENCGRLLCDIIDEELKYVFLGHLSQENNYPDLALESVKCELAQNMPEMSVDGILPQIIVAFRDRPSQVIDL